MEQEIDKEKESNKKTRKKIFENILIAIIIMIFFMTINITYFKIEETMLLNVMKIISFVILIFSIILFEIAYHKDSGKIAINGIEALVLAFYILTIWQEVKKFDVEFDLYILFSTYLFAIYYVFKSILIYTKDKRDYLKSLSDIHEIVQIEPVKKEAKKRKKLNKI